MSSRLYWRPHELDKARVDLDKGDDTLKLVLRKEYGYPLDVVLGRADVGMLKGMAMMGCKNAEKAIEHIEKYDEISLFEGE